MLERGDTLSTVLNKLKTSAKNTYDAMSDKLQTIFTDPGTDDQNLKNVNTPEQQTLTDNVLQDYSVFKSARQTIEPLWQEDQRFYIGDHWFGLRSNEASKRRPNSKDNLAWAQTEAIVSKLAGWDPWPDFQAQEPNDEEKASDLNAFMPYELRQIKFKEKYTFAIRQCVLHGPLIFKTIFDPDVEGGRGLKRYEGRNDIIPVEIGSFFPDPRITDFIYLQDMGAIIIHTRKTIEYFRQKWPKQGKKVAPDNNAQDVQIFNYPNAGQAQNTFNYTDSTYYWDANTQSQTAGLLEYWYRGLPKMMTDEDKKLFKEQAESLLMDGKDPSEAMAKAEGRMEGVHCVYTTTSGVFLEHKSYVYDHGMYPFVARTLFPNYRNVWGKGFMRDMIQPQIMLNKFAEIAVETMAKSGNSAIMYEQGAITKLGTWRDNRSMEGAMLEVEPGRMGDVKELQGVNVPGTVFNMLNYYQEMLQKIPGQFDSANGAPNSNVKSGEQAKALIAAASTRLNTVSDLISDALADVFKQYIELIAQFYTDERIARVTGREVAISRDALVSSVPTTYEQTTEDGQVTPQQVIEEYLPEFDILVNITAEKPLDSQYWIQMAFNMLGMQDPITGLPMVDAEAVRYTIANGRMEPMEIIKDRIQKEAGVKQQMEQMSQQMEQMAQQLQQMQSENMGMQQKMAEVFNLKQQQEQADRQYDQQLKSRKLDIEEAKVMNDFNSQQQMPTQPLPIASGGGGGYYG